MKDYERFVLSMSNMAGRLKYSTLIKKEEEKTDNIPVWKINKGKWFEENKNRPNR